MKYHHPIERIEFEIPDDWLQQLDGLGPQSLHSDHYSYHEPNAKLVPIADIIAPRRTQGVRWFDQNRSISIISAFRANGILPPIRCHFIPQTTHLTVQDGFHRYYLSIAFGFTHIPAKIVDYFNIYDRNA